MERIASDAFSPKRKGAISRPVFYQCLGIRAKLQDTYARARREVERTGKREFPDQYARARVLLNAMVATAIWHGLGRHIITLAVWQARVPTCQRLVIREANILA